MQSALSPHVRHIITEIGVHSDSSSKKYLTTSKLINWDEICDVLPEINASVDIDDQETTEYFKKCAYGLGFLFQECEQVILSTDVKDLSKQYKELIFWTNQDKVITECYKLVKSESLLENYLALLLLTSCLERALGDVYLSKNKFCPSLLKDLLASEFLQKTFGDVPVQTLRAVIGPPVSLNLRNIVWHGFPAEQEISRRYTCFLLIVFPSLNQFINFTVIHREPVIFTQESLYSDHLPETKDISQDELKTFLKCSDFIPSYQLRLWQYAVDLYVTGQHGKAVVLLLPLLEHALRSLFTRLNNCHERTVTAEAKTLYTTLDQILDQFVREDENKLPNQLGHPVMDILLDLFCYPCGPRIRDKLSHGEADVNNFPRSLCTVVLVVIIHIAGRYRKVEFVNFNDMQQEWVQRINRWVNQYESIFHPVSLLKSKIKHVALMTGQFSKQIILDYNRAERVTWLPEEIVNPYNKENDVLVKEISVLINLVCDKWYSERTVTDIINRLFCPFSDGSSYICDMLNVKITTLFWYQRESGQGYLDSETVNLLHKISSECESVLNQVYTALQTRQEQLIKKQLRSRQRDNLGSLIDSCFMIHQAIQLVLFLVTMFLVTIETDTPQSIVKFLKVMLQFSENLRTFTNEKNNKWLGCTYLLFKFIEKLKLFLQ